MSVARRNIFLGLGSNMGDRLGNLQIALDTLAAQTDQKVCRCSPVYETTPWGVVDQPLYLNAVVQIESNLSPGKLLDLCKRIEKLAGRKRRTRRWVERELDIDILLIEGRELHSKRLTVPHPRLLERRFALRPLSDLEVDMAIPGVGWTVGEALQRCSDRGEVRLIHEALRL